MNPGRIFLGILLSAFGLVLLLVNFDVLTPEIVRQLMLLWPLLLVAIGIAFIFDKGDNSHTGCLVWVLIILVLLVLFSAQGPFMHHPRFF